MSTTTADADLKSVLAANLKAAREKKRLDVDDAARAAGITMDAWYKIERGERWPSAANLDAIAKAVGTSADRLIRR